MVQVDNFFRQQLSENARMPKLTSIFDALYVIRNRDLIVTDTIEPVPKYGMTNALTTMTFRIDLKRTTPLTARLIRD